MKTQPIEITVTHKFDDKQIASLLCSALEGGSNYWYTIDEFIKPPVCVQQLDFGKFRHIDYPLSPGGALIISAEEDDERQRCRLDREAIMKGLQVMADKYPRHFGNWMNEQDDAETGDVFLQCCLFGELVYG